MLIFSLQTSCFHCRLGSFRTSQFRGYSESPNYKRSYKQLPEPMKPLRSQSWSVYAVVCYLLHYCFVANEVKVHHLNFLPFALFGIGPGCVRIIVSVFL